MNSQQYNRANKRVFLAVIIVFAYIAFTLFAAVGTKDADITRISIQLVAAIAVIVIAVIAFITKRDSRTGALILVSAMTAGYFIIALINSTIGTWTYALPLVIAAMIYLDIKMMMVMNAVIIISSVIRLVMQLGIGGTVLQNDVIAVFVLVLVGYASDSITILLTHFFDENMEEIKESAMAQVDSNKKMVMVAENISKHFDEAMTMLNDLDESVAVSHSSIQEIADSTESTAEAIQKQAAMCVDIQGNTDNAESGIKAMIDASRQTDETVKQGADVVEELKEQAHNVAEASNVTVSVIQSLTAKVEEVKSFVESIINISNQTNLLALNASIEAARAGEAGKGFAVVADEIRNLSNGTKESSGSIMQALSRLEETSAKMMDSIAQTIELIQLNIEKVSNVNRSVTKITNDAATLGENIKIVDSAVKEVETSNKTLTDNMNQVGAVMNDMTESINKAELTTKTMLSKYESSAKSAMDIEDVVGKLMEELGVGGFMGVQDVRSGMKISISNVNGVKKEYSGEVVERKGNELYITVDEKDSELFDKKDKHTRCNFNIVVDNVLYYWENISIRHSKAAESGEYKLYIESNPQVHNRRKYPRMPIANACTIKFENDDKTYNGRMVNVSANGFAFSVCDSAFVNAKDKNIIVSVDNFDEICTNPLEGCIIRCSNNDGEYTVGCRMPEDIMSIKHYVNKNYCN